jgi:hypothetical protein
MERAKLKGRPYVPYDIDELKLLTCHTALRHLPVANDPKAIPGWSYQTFFHTSYPYSVFIDNLFNFADRQLDKTTGIMVSPLKDMFFFYVKEPND